MLELSMAQLGFTYRHIRGGGPAKGTDISSATVAESVLSVWRKRPHQAKFMSGEHFGKLYDLIFSSDLNGSQAIIASLLLRFADKRRKTPPANSPDFLSYGACFIAMLMGEYLLKDLNITLSALSHKNFSEAKKLVEDQGDLYFNRAVKAIQEALLSLYGNQKVSLQRLSATFRRGDLIEELARISPAR